MKSSIYDYCIYLVGTSTNTLESSVSAILRTVEVFNPKEIEIFYSKFAKDVVEHKVKNLINTFLGKEPITKPLPEVKDYKTFFEHKLQELKKKGSPLLVPTAGSVSSIIFAVYAATKLQIDIAHVLFPYGRWTKFYYPFVPRYLQPIMILSHNSTYSQDNTLTINQGIYNLHEHQINEIISSIPMLHKEIAYLSYLINKKWTYKPMVNDFNVPKLCIEIKRDNNDLVIELKVDNIQVDGMSLELSTIKLLGKRGYQNLSFSSKESVEQFVKDIERTASENGFNIDLSVILPGNCKISGVHSLCSDINELRKFENLLLGTIILYILAICSEAQGKFNKNIPLDKRNIIKKLHELRYLLGVYEPALDSTGEDGKRIIIDTNVIYGGIHNYASSLGNKVYVPYCAEVEVLLRFSESKEICLKFLDYCAFIALDVLKHYCNYMPTLPEKCDFSIPKIDPDLVKDSYIITRDEAARELWNRLAISRYAHIEPAKFIEIIPQKEKIHDLWSSINMYSKVHFTILQLYAIFRLFYKELFRNANL